LDIENRARIAEAKAAQIQAKARLAEANAKIELAKSYRHTLRTVKNSGYSESGASRIKKSMRGWTAQSRTPQEDIDFNLYVLRQRSRDLYMGSPLARSAIQTNRTNVVGSGLKLKSRINFKYLGITQDQADEWEMDTEREFGIWADSVWCDALRLNNFYELQQIALTSWLMNGEGFALIKDAERKPWMPYSLRLHLIEADRISNPNYISGDIIPIVTANNGNRIINGIEIDSDGAIAAYHVCSHYPNSFIDFKLWEWARIEAFGRLTGQPNILHLMENERCEQYRGVPYLAPVIEALKQITRYTEAELMAAVVTAFFTVFIKQNGTTTELPFNDVIQPEQKVETDSNAYEMGAGTVNMLGPGEEAQFADPKRPASGFDAFVTSMSRQIGAALEVPYELLSKAFTASYSASRAALLEAWKAFKMRRTWFANDFCQPVYELWLSEAVARGRVNAPGFFVDPAIRKAWCQADWNGPAPGQLDPVKEVQAATMRVGQGFSTRERETIELTGGDWDRNITQIQRENDLLEKAGIIMNTNVQIQEGGKNNE
jgi:lambda family phage portal protein